MAGTYETASGSNRFGVLRLTRRGARDPSFEGGGGPLVDVPGVYREEVTGTAVQSDDRIVLAGHGCEGTQPVVDGSCRRVFVVVRVTPSGATDTTFGGSSGVVTTSFPSADDAEAYAVTIQPNGRIVVVGAADVDGSARLALVRYRTNGTLDPTFDGDGRVLTNVTTSRDEAAHAVAIQPDGEIVVAGVANVGTESAPRYRFALARYRADGSLDPSLDGDGIAITGAGPWNLVATAVALTPNGRIVVAGEARERRPATIHRCSIYRLALVRYLADGRPDPSFDGDGRVLRAGPSSRATAVSVQLDGRIVAVGASERGVNQCGLRTDFLVRAIRADRGEHRGRRADSDVPGRGRTALAGRESAARRTRPARRGEHALPEVDLRPRGRPLVPALRSLLGAPR